MGKTAIDTAIGLITTGGLNTAVEAVDIWQKLENELFAETIKTPMFRLLEGPSEK